MNDICRRNLCGSYGVLDIVKIPNKSNFLIIRFNGIKDLVENQG